MKISAEKIIALVQLRQEAGKVDECPRCGRSMRSPITHNALSRRCQCYICSECGVEEAMADWLGQEDGIENWYVVKELQ